MPKNIALFADGTWNGPTQDHDGDGVPDVTNVLKLYANLQGLPTIETLKLQDEQERIAYAADGSLLQVAKYIHGVGDSRNLIHRLLGGTLGAGITKRIIRGYTFISRYYEPGDLIYTVGFSRGAYTARALAGLITKVGLLDKTKLNLVDRELSYRYGLSAWQKYREGVSGVDTRLVEQILVGEAEPIPNGHLVNDVCVRAVGVWDTVGALGIPKYFGETRLDTFRFADSQLSPHVEHGFHAVSIDEQRADFAPTLWNARQGIEQIWFPGAHADVGGGYPDPEAGLSNVALKWMTERLESVGLLVDLHGVYRSNDGLPYEFHEPWNEGIWKHRPPVPRSIPADGLFHPELSTVLEGYADYGVDGALAAILSGRKIPSDRLAPVQAPTRRH